MSTARGTRLWVVGGLLLALLLTGATYLLVIAPARSEVSSVQSQVDDAALQQSVLRNRLRDLEKVAADSGDLDTQLAAATSALPAAVDTQGLLRTVQQFATAAGAVVENVTIGEATASAVPDVWAVPAEIAVLGSPDGLVAFLASLQTDNTRLVTIASSELKEKAGSVYRLSLTTRVYTSAPPASTAADGTAGGTAPGGAAAGGAAAGGAAAGGGGSAAVSDGTGS